jgi:hypothetical protein
MPRDVDDETHDAGTREMIDRLRSLPPEGTEPDWRAMERAIREEVGDVVPRPWWQPAWRWLVPAAMLTLAAAVFALWIRDPAPADRAQVVAVPVDAETPVVVPDEIAATTMPLWLDGQEVEIDLAAEQLLDVDPALIGEDDSLSPGLLPVDNLAWIDELDVEDVDVADDWLGRKKG